VDLVRRDEAVLSALAEAGLEVGQSLQLGSRGEVWEYTVYWQAYRQKLSKRKRPTFALSGPIFEIRIWSGPWDFFVGSGDGKFPIGSNLSSLLIEKLKHV